MAKAVIFDMYETLVTLIGEPVYFGVQIAQDAGIPFETYRPLWMATEHERNTGVSFEDNVSWILSECGVDPKPLIGGIKAKRLASRVAPFNRLHPEILPMLEELKARGTRIGLISNCTSDEAEAIRGSLLYPYFDAPVLSYEVGLEKPDERIFCLALERLKVKPEECLYVGDGGSMELESSTKLGMKAYQACWYLQDSPNQQSTRKEGFTQLESPIEILDLC